MLRQMPLDDIDPLGYTPLHIPTDPFDEELDTFVKFSEEMRQNSVKPTDEEPNVPFSACNIPDTLEGRQDLIKKVFSLFEAELRTLGFDGKQRFAIRRALKTFIPDPFNPDFEHIFKDRVCGFFSMMMLLRKLFLASANRDVVVTQAQHLSAGLDGYSGVESLLSVLPYEQMRDLMYPKTGRLSCLTEILQFSPHLAQKVEQLDEILTVYFVKVMELGLSEKRELKYRKFLMSEICFFDKRRSDLDLHFKVLIEATGRASGERFLTAAIGQFGEEKLNVNLTEGPNETEARRFPEFFTELKQADRVLGRDKPAGYSVVGISGSEKIREQIRQKLVALFNADVEDPGLRQLLEGGVGSLLDTSDPDFDSALTDRNCGAIEILRFIYNDMTRTVERGEDPASAFVGFAQLVQGVDKLPWKNRNGNDKRSRRDELMKRLEARKTSQRLVENGRSFETVCSKIPLAEDLLKEIRMNFMEAGEDLGINFENRAQWFYVFIQNLADFVEKKAKIPFVELHNALVELRETLASATKRDEIARAIYNFVQKKLPSLSQPSA